jgi:hypothetical protein
VKPDIKALFLSTLSPDVELYPVTQLPSYPVTQLLIVKRGDF